jgi:hypothetical protein
MDSDFILSRIDTPVGKIPKVTPEWSAWDLWGTLRVRWSGMRMNYRVEPGLYAIGNPDENSPVLLSANYKLSFDCLRRSLREIDAWILVLDTKGINVWCAAGKGSFGSDEVVHRIQKTELFDLVKHRELIAPQLAAPGVSAHEVRAKTAFRGVYGPVYAKDIKAFLDAGKKCAPEMRRVTFSLCDRLILAPMEIVNYFKYLLGVSIFFFLASGINKEGYSASLVLTEGWKSLVLLVSGYLSGTFLSPALLPWLPGCAFSIKGFFSGIIVFIVLLLLGTAGKGIIEPLSWFLIITAGSSFLTLNFTGSTPYTSISGVKKEVKTWLPLHILFFMLGFILWMTMRFFK